MPEALGGPSPQTWQVFVASAHGAAKVLRAKALAARGPALEILQLDQELSISVNFKRQARAGRRLCQPGRHTVVPWMHDQESLGTK